MLKLKLVRTIKTPNSTIGDLYLDNVWFSYTLEDVERDDGVKVYGETAIPKGTYNVVVDFSNRFKRRMPHILDVPGFTGIRIHGGNTAADTEGCILVGQTKGPDYVGQSKVAFESLLRKLLGETEPITIEIV